MKFIIIIISGLLSNGLPDNHEILSQKHNIIGENNLSILSWNIKMLPPPYGWSQNPLERAENIIQTLKNSKIYDVILFQEAFSGNIRNIIFNALKNIYPNQIEPHDNTHFYKNNSGLWIISCNAIILIDEISFSHLRGWDKLVSKGAKLYSITKNQQEFYLINTHMQADYQTKYSNIRTSQYMEIQEKLILPNENPEIPVILCGDLNIARPSKLKLMLERINFMNGPLIGDLKYSSLGSKHELLDYILVKKKNFKFKSIERRIQDMSVNLFIDPIKLSDHYPIEGIFKW